MSTILSLVVLSLCLLCLYGNDTEKVVSIDGTNSLPVPQFPLQFSATLEITAHLLPENSSYPPHKRRMSLVYDYVNGRARVDQEKGYEAAKFYIRRYDNKQEYMVRLPPIDDCKRSYLGEVMPEPDLSGFIFKGVEVVDGQECNYFVHTEYNVRCHIYMRVHDNAPVRLHQESISQDGTVTALLSYDYADVFLGPADISWFELPNPFEHSSCTRHIGGFPYLHIFHYFVKF